MLPICVSTTLNLQINKEKSETTHERFKEHPEQWFQYQELLEQNNKDWPVLPVDVIIKRIEQFPSWWKVGDFGCGKALIMNKLGNRIFSYDHYAVDERVTSCDMKSVPLPSKSLEIIVFCLSLMGTNWPDYINEARRCLVTNGTLLIAETTHSLEEGRLSNLVDILTGNNFEIYSRYEIEPFTFIEATKRESLRESAK